ncbi:MAG: hypothetical protein ACI841_000347 [Planctomycetota bacterium]
MAETLLFIPALNAGRQPAGLPFALLFGIFAPLVLLGGALPGGLLGPRYTNALRLFNTSMTCLLIFVIEMLVIATSLSSGS